MEEIDTKKENKKPIIIVGLSLFLVIVLIICIGVTSAYFLVDVKNDITEPTTVEASFGKNVKAILTQEDAAKNLRLNLTASDMSLEKAIKEVEYYADNVNNYVTEQKEGMKKLATLKIEGSEEGLVYKCSAKIKVAKKAEASNTMLTALKDKSGDIELYLRGGDLIVKEDLSNIVDDIEAGGKEYDINYIIEGNGSDDLLGYIKLNNKKEQPDLEGYDADQSYIADKDLNIEIKTEDIDCEILLENDTIKTLRSKDTNNTLSTHLTGEMYRYQGSNDKVTNNYVCLGSDCSQNTDKMYRIIGITPDGEMKLIKKEALDSTYQWYTNYNEDIKWPQSKIYEAISNTAFLNNTNYIPEGWQDKIKDTNWIYGDMFSNNNQGARQTGPELYKTEMGLKPAAWNEKSTEEAGGIKYPTTTGTNPPVGTVFYYKGKNEYWTDYINSKVGLMYVSDYYLAASDTANCHYGEGAEKYTVCKEQGWLHLSKNDDTPKSGHEWTISRFGWSIDHGGFHARFVNSDGYSSSWYLTSSLSVRPSFYLPNDITITDGNGSIGQPFILSI